MVPNEQDYAIVVAHPDDEILWASSIIKNAKKVIICFGKTSSLTISKGRIGFSLKAPKNFYFLNVPEPNDIGFNYYPIKSLTSDNCSKPRLSMLLDTEISEFSHIFSKTFFAACPEIFSSLR